MRPIFLLIGGIFVAFVIAIVALSYTIHLVFELAGTLPFSISPSASPLTVIHPNEPEPDYVLKTLYHTEQEWIVSSICRNSFEILSYIADKKGEIVPPENVTVTPVPGNDTAYAVTLRGASVTVQATLHWPGSIRASAPYVPFCQAAMAQLKITPPTTPPQVKGTPMETLLDFSEAAIQGENLRISSWLNEDPANSVAQQQAAFLLGVLALKENSGWFWDARDSCNHLTAHLAVARALAPDAPLLPEGQLAECATGLIVDTKKECGDELDQIGKLDPSSTALAAWVRAGRLRNSRDWRLIDKPENATPVEQVEYVRALIEAVTPDRAITWLQANNIPMRQDWNRLVLQGAFSVDAGHAFAQPAILGEIRLMQSTFPGRFSTQKIVTDLNELPEDVLIPGDGGANSLTVISNGQWAAYFQRHLCHAIVETGEFFADKWGVPEQTADLDQATARNFSGLNLYPYLLIANQLERNNPSPADPRATAAAFVKHPDSAPAFAYEINPAGQIDPNRWHGLVSSWFSPAFPAGTALDAFSRVNNVGEALTHQPEAIHRLYLIAPLQYKIAELELKSRYGEHPTYQQVREIMGPLVDYYYNAIDLAAEATGTSLDDQIALYRKAAENNPDSYYSLAETLRSAGRDADAAAAYQQWYDQATDRVAVSNSMEWLVDYYYDHGQQDKAMSIAKECAEVYSDKGLETMMHLLERTGRIAEAEDYGQKIVERYQDNTPLLALYKQQADLGNAAYKEKLKDAVSTLFPDGLKQVTPASFSGPPADGMKFASTTDVMQRDGVSSSQVVVAIDGYQIHNAVQYTLVRGFSSSPHMTLIVWDGATYRELSFDLPGRLFGVDTTNYSR